MEREAVYNWLKSAKEKMGLTTLQIIEKGLQAIEKEEEWIEQMEEAYQDQYALEGHNNSMDQLLQL